MINNKVKKKYTRNKTIACILTVSFIIGAMVPSISSDSTDPWWNPQWHYRKEITINHAKINGDLNDFPVLINIIDTNLSLKAQPDGNDIVFTSKTGTILNYEIESYDSSTGNLITWVKIPFLSSTQDTIIYIYYGNQNYSDQQNSEGTWDTHFLAVHHLEETAGIVIDSTNHHNNGTTYGSLNQNVTGKVDGADNFDGTDDKIVLPPIFSNQNQFTLEAWIYPQSGARYFISQRATNGVFIQVGDGGGFIQWYINSDKDQINGIQLNTWYYIVLTYDGSTARFYKNAETPRIKTCNPPIWPTEGMFISDRSAGTRPFHGMIDEVRFSNIARDTNWITTCFSNQNNPFAFYQLGTEEIYRVPQAPVISNERPADGSTNISRNLASLGFTLSHPYGTPMTYTVMTTPDITNGPQTETNIVNTTIYIPITQIPLNTSTQYSWTITAYDGTAWTNKTFSFTTEQPVTTDPWWNPNWQYRKKILINHTNIMSNLTEFPVFIQFTDLDLAINTQTDGDDIAFASKIGNKLNHEIEIYNATTGELTVWVNIPFISAIEDTIFYIYYGNPDCNNQQNRGATWNSNYIGVWHMNDATSSIVNDSTNQQNNGIKRGPNEPLHILARIGEGQIYDGINDLINAGNNPVFEMDRFTASLWIKPERFAWPNYLIGKYQSTSTGEWYLSFSSAAPYNKLRVVLIDSDGIYQSRESATSLPLNTWTHVDLVYNGTLSFYINGIRDANTRIINKNVKHSPTAKVIIGNFQFNSYPFMGTIDEVCISNIGRNAAWIATCYKNQNDPATFYTLGTQEMYSSGEKPVISNEQPASGTTNVMFDPLLQADVYDPNGDLVEWRIESNASGTWIILSSGTLQDGNGTISTVTFNMNMFNTTYWWKVFATDPGGSGEYSIRTFSFTTKTQNTPPDLLNPSPSNLALNVPPNPLLSMDVNDSDGDQMTIIFSTNASGSWQTLGIYTNVSNGRYSQQTSNLNQYAKTYWWKVSTTDPFGSGQWTNQTYSFKTVANAIPIISDVYPNNQNANYNPQLSVNIFDTYGDNFSVIFKTNATGQWNTIGTYYGGNGAYKQNTMNMTIKGKNYYWSINVFDGTAWVNRTYRFTAQPFVLKWIYRTYASTLVGPLAVDINHDGFYEIFSTGEGKISCVSGKNGTLLWNYSNIEIGLHSPFEIGDLNNDGIPEVVISGNETYHDHGKTIALHANNGSVYWIVQAESGGKYLGIVDTDGNGYPYVYVASGDFIHGLNGLGRLRKLRGTDGAILKQVFLWRPCWGGISIADADNDGKFEIYVTDRCANYHNQEQPGKGMQCYDADTLELLWYQDIVTCSSHCMVLLDVNNDGILDAVAQNQASNNSGIYVIDGATWEKMPGYCAYNIGFLSAHSQFSIYDIDNDGRLEICTARDAIARVYDLGRRAIDASLIYYSEPPKMADVIGDSHLEIIGCGSTIKIYNGTTYAVIETINTDAISTTLVQDIDNDGQNELIAISGDGTLKAYDTSAYAPTPRIRTNNQFYSERRLAAGVYIPPPGAPQPIIKAVTPLNGAQDVTLNPTVGAHVVDFHYDRMNITISTNASGTWQDIAAYHNVGNAWYNVTTTTMNQSNTTYYWRVTASDPWADKRTTTQNFSFTTATSPTITNIIAPPSASQGQPVNISCHVTDNDRVNLVKINVTYPDGHSSNTTAIAIPPGWQTLRYDDFETGFGNYTDGSTTDNDCQRIKDPLFAHHGNYSIRIRTNNGINSSFALTNGIAGKTNRYSQLRIDFWFKNQSMDLLDNFWVKYWDGAHWRLAANYRSGEHFEFKNTSYYHKIVFINDTTFPFHDNMKIRFQCDATTGDDQINIDQVYINATTGQSINYYYNTSYTQLGTYHYFIWAQDNHGNSIRSQIQTFDIVP